MLLLLLLLVLRPETETPELRLRVLEAELRAAGTSLCDASLSVVGLSGFEVRREGSLAVGLDGLCGTRTERALDGFVLAWLPNSSKFKNCHTGQTCNSDGRQT